MKNEKLPPGQHEINTLLRWNVDHPGIVPKNPEIDLGKWRLTLDGEVENPLKLSWQEFLKIPAVESVSDFHCVEGWTVRSCRWYGVKFDAIIDIVKPRKDAESVFFKCADGYTTSFDLVDLMHDSVLLAYKLNGEWLEVPFGGPMRLIAPDKYAYKSAMWVGSITFRAQKELGYWEKRGYSDTADVWKNDRFRR